MLFIVGETGAIVGVDNTKFIYAVCSSNGVGEMSKHRQYQFEVRLRLAP